FFWSARARPLFASCSLRSSLTVPPPPATPTLSLHDALPIFILGLFLLLRIGDGPTELLDPVQLPAQPKTEIPPVPTAIGNEIRLDRKSTRLNSSHVSISYAVFCLKKKMQTRRVHAGSRSSHV